MNLNQQNDLMLATYLVECGQEYGEHQPGEHKPQVILRDTMRGSPLEKFRLPGAPWAILVPRPLSMPQRASPLAALAASALLPLVGARGSWTCSCRQCAARLGWGGESVRGEVLRVRGDRQPGTRAHMADEDRNRPARCRRLRTAKFERLAAEADGAEARLGGIPTEH